MFHRRLMVLSAAMAALALAVAGCERPAAPTAAVGPARSGAAANPEDAGILEQAKASGAWSGQAMPGLSLDQTKRQVVYEAKIGAVVRKLMTDPSKTSTNDFGSVVINTDGVADLPTILGEAGFKDYMANAKAINLAQAADAVRRGRQ